MDSEDELPDGQPEAPGTDGTGTDGTGTDGTGTDGTGTGTAPTAAAAPAAAGNRTRSLAAVGVAVLAVLGLLAWFVASGDEEPPPTTTTTTTTATSTTTTTAPGRPALVSQVATAKEGVSAVFVKEQPPEGWDTMEPAIVWDAPELPASQAEFPDRPALPRDDYDIKGRYTTDDGWEFSNPTAFGGVPTFLVTEQRGDWAEVLMPVRPNGTKGYIDTNQVDMSEHDYRVELDISDRHLVAYRGTEVIAESSVVVGRDSTRTPTGRFYVTDKTEDTPSSFYGPAMLPLNGYSEQLDLFEDGVPVIAIHGTSRPDQVGQAVSNGCVRMPNEIVTLLYDQLPLGTQVEITA